MLAFFAANINAPEKIKSILTTVDPNLIAKIIYHLHKNKLNEDKDRLLQAIASSDGSIFLTYFKSLSSYNIEKTLQTRTDVISELLEQKIDKNVAAVRAAASSRASVNDPTPTAASSTNTASPGLTHEIETELGQYINTLPSAELQGSVLANLIAYYQKDAPTIIKIFTQLDAEMQARVILDARKQPTPKPPQKSFPVGLVIDEMAKNDNSKITSYFQYFDNSNEACFLYMMKELPENPNSITRNGYIFIENENRPKLFYIKDGQNVKEAEGLDFQGKIIPSLKKIMGKKTSETLSEQQIKDLITPEGGAFPHDAPFPSDASFEFLCAAFEHVYSLSSRDDIDNYINAIFSGMSVATQEKLLPRLYAHYDLDEDRKYFIVKNFFSHNPKSIMDNLVRNIPRPNYVSPQITHSITTIVTAAKQEIAQPALIADLLNCLLIHTPRVDAENKNDAVTEIIASNFLAKIYPSNATTDQQIFANQVILAKKPDGSSVIKPEKLAKLLVILAESKSESSARLFEKVFLSISNTANNNVYPNLLQNILLEMFRESPQTFSNKLLSFFEAWIKNLKGEKDPALSAIKPIITLIGHITKAASRNDNDKKDLCKI